MNEPNENISFNDDSSFDQQFSKLIHDLRQTINIPRPTKYVAHDPINPKGESVDEILDDQAYQDRALDEYLGDTDFDPDNDDDFVVSH
jgi:hypothetical protein